MLGQALGLPTTMTFYSFIGIAVTSATVVVFGRAIWDPVEVLSRLGNPIAVVVAMLALLLATLNVNVAANVVSPSNDFSNLYPRKISFKLGGVITCFIGLLMQPWRWLSSHGSYVMGWLVGYSSFLGPIAGVMIADYYVLHKRVILADDLYQRGGAYEFSRGFNWARHRRARRRRSRSVKRPGNPRAPRPLSLRLVRRLRRLILRLLVVDAKFARRSA